MTMRSCAHASPHRDTRKPALETTPSIGPNGRRRFQPRAERADENPAEVGDLERKTGRARPI
jgi:hypothetical protein